MVFEYSKFIRKTCEEYPYHVSYNNKPNVNKNAANKEIRCNAIRWSVKNNFENAIAYLLGKSNHFIKGVHAPNHVFFSDSDTVNVSIFVYTNPYYLQEQQILNSVATNPDPVNPNAVQVQQPGSVAIPIGSPV